MAAPAAAHVCTAPAEVRTGELSTVVITIASEGPTPVVAVDVVLPAGFELANPPIEEQLSVLRRGDELQISGLRIPAASCGRITLRGTAKTAGIFYFPLRTHAEDGDVQLLDQRTPSDPKGAMKITATGTLGRKDGLSTAAVVSLSLVALGVVGLAARLRQTRGRSKKPVGR